MNTEERRCIIITGAVDSGKTTLARRMIKDMRRRGLRVEGILTVAEYRKGRKCRYRVLDLADGGERLLLDEERDLEGGRVGRFFFSAEAFDWAGQRLREASLSGADALCLDEAGPLELRGGGYGEVLEELFERSRGIILLVVRESVKKAFIEKALRYGWRPEIYRPDDAAAVPARSEGDEA